MDREKQERGKHERTKGDGGKRMREREMDCLFLPTCCAKHPSASLRSSTHDGQRR